MAMRARLTQRMNSDPTAAEVGEGGKTCPIRARIHAIGVKNQSLAARTDIRGGKFARQSLRTMSCVEESPGPAEQDAG